MKRKSTVKKSMYVTVDMEAMESAAMLMLNEV